MARPVIEVDRLSKSYRLGAIGASSVRDRLELWWAERRGAAVSAGRAGRAREFWALREVSFTVEPGEVVGIVGRNGAGKSTALKLLSRITAPTSGRAVLRGRAASLLEVGTGFHPDLSGRDNIYMNGAILGMRIAEIAARFDDIVDFAEIGAFLDTPVKRYSSGMYVRLAFAVAAHLEPEILLIDEVLAVGDAAFQKKCLGKLGDVARAGRTVLFVSHNMTAVQSLCTSALWLDQGRIAAQGRVGAVIADYLRVQMALGFDRSWPDPESAPGNQQVRLAGVRLVPEDGTEPDQITVRTPLAIEFDYWNLAPGARLNLSLQVSNEEGQCVFVSVSTREPDWHGRPFPQGLFRSRCRIPANLLNDGLYSLVLLVVRDTSRVVYKFDDVLAFEVKDVAEARGDWYGKWVGAVRPQLDWSTEQLSPVAAAAPLAHT
jgi:lipopolysaccharide transport system ATP-binding protein